MHAPIKYVEKGLSIAANGAWHVFSRLNRIKQNPATQGIPVVMMTSVNDVYDYRSQIEESFFPHDRWLNKPVKAEVLLKTLREVLGEAA